MNINQAGLDLLKSFEGCKLKSYQDVGGIWTIGYGAVGDGIGPNVVWTQEQADKRLADDLERFDKGVEAALKHSVTENQFASLVCLAYNIGLANFRASTLLKLTNQGDFAGAAAQFLRWNKVRNQVVAGLTRRRQAESALFLS